MARLFDGSDDVLSVDSAPVTAAPLTMACWARSNSATALQRALYLGDKDTDTHVWSLAFAGPIGGDPIRFTVSAGTAITLDTTTGYTAGTWHHICAVEASATNHAVFIDGGSKGTSVTSRAPLNTDRIAVGRFMGTTPANSFSGDLAEVAVWNVALTDADVALLAKAVSPFMVRPDALVFYLPIVGQYSPEIDVVGGLNLAVTGAAASAHPRVLYLPSVATPMIAPTQANLDTRSKRASAIYVSSPWRDAPVLPD